MYNTKNTKNEFGGDEECDLSYERCRRLEVIARKVEKQLRKEKKPIIKEVQMFDGWKEKKKKKKKKY